MAVIVQYGPISSQFGLFLLRDHTRPMSQLHMLMHIMSLSTVLVTTCGRVGLLSARRAVSTGAHGDATYYSVNRKPMSRRRDNAMYM
jgi:hypothetical protein